MIPAANVIAGIIIGLANSSWLTTLAASAIWPFVFCAYVSIADRGRRDDTIAAFAERGRHLFLGSPVLTFYGIEFLTALLTTVPVALLAYAVKRLIT